MHNNKSYVLESSPPHPLCPWKNCLVQNWSLVPKSLETTVLGLTERESGTGRLHCPHLIYPQWNSQVTGWDVQETHKNLSQDVDFRQRHQRWQLAFEDCSHSGWHCVWVSIRVENAVSLGSTSSRFSMRSGASPTFSGEVGELLTDRWIIDGEPGSWQDELGLPYWS